MSDKDTLVGRITFEFHEDKDDGQWYSKVSPEMTTTEIRKIYKLALIVAVLQDTCKNKLSDIDRLIMNNAEIAALHNATVEEKKHNKLEADVDKYQQPLPFKELSNNYGNT